MPAQISPHRLSPANSSEPGDGLPPPAARAATLAGILASLVLAGCGSSTAPQPPSLSGTYAFGVNIANTREGIRCDISGTVEFVQDGDLFSGTARDTVACSGLGSNFTREETPDIDGQFRGRAAEVEFTILRAPCEARGTASGSPVETLSGSVSCTFLIEDRIFDLNGTWEVATATGPAT